MNLDLTKHQIEYLKEMWGYLYNDKSRTRFQNRMLNNIQTILDEGCYDDGMKKYMNEEIKEMYKNYTSYTYYTNFK